MNARYSWQSLDDVRLWIARTVIALTVSGALVGVFAEISGLALLASLCGAPLYAVWAYHNWKDYTKKKGELKSKLKSNDPKAAGIENKEIENKMKNDYRAFWLHLLWAVGMVFLMLASLNALVGIGVSTAFILSIPVLGPIIPVLYTLGWFGEVYNAMWKNVDENDDKGQVLRLTTLARVQMLTATSCLAIPLGAMALTGGLGAATLIMPLAIPFALSSVYTLCKLIRIKSDGKYKPDPLMGMIEKMLTKNSVQKKEALTTLRNRIFGFLLAAGCALGYGLGYGAGFVLGVGVSVTAAPILLGVAASLTLASFSFKEFFVDSRSKNNRLFGAVIPLLGSIGLFVGTVLLPTVPIISVLGVMLFAGGAAVRWFNRSRNNAYMRDLKRMGENSDSAEGDKLTVRNVKAKIGIAKKYDLGGIDLWAKLADYACQATQVADDSTGDLAEQRKELAQRSGISAIIDRLIEEVEGPYLLSAKDIDDLAKACRDLAEVAAKKPDVEKETLHTLISETITKITERGGPDVPMPAFANLVAAVKNSGFTNTDQMSSLCNKLRDKVDSSTGKSDIDHLSVACRDLAEVVAKKPDFHKEELHTLISKTITKITDSGADVSKPAFANLVAAVKNSGFTDDAGVSMDFLSTACRDLAEVAAKKPDVEKETLHPLISDTITKFTKEGAADVPMSAFANLVAAMKKSEFDGPDKIKALCEQLCHKVDSSTGKSDIDHLSVACRDLAEVVAKKPDYQKKELHTLISETIVEITKEGAADVPMSAFANLVAAVKNSGFTNTRQINSLCNKLRDKVDSSTGKSDIDHLSVACRDLAEVAAKKPDVEKETLHTLISDTITKITESGADAPMPAFANLVAAVKNSGFTDDAEVSMDFLSTACRDLAKVVAKKPDGQKKELHPLISDTITKFTKEGGPDVPMPAFANLVAAMKKGEFDEPDKIKDLCEQLCDKVKDGSIEAADMNHLSAACRDLAEVAAKIPDNESKKNLHAYVSEIVTKAIQEGESDVSMSEFKALVASMGESQFRGKLEAEVEQLIRPENELDAGSDSKTPSTSSVVSALLENSALFSSSPDTETVQQPGAEIEFYVRFVMLLAKAKSDVVSLPMLESVVRAILDRGSRQEADSAAVFSPSPSPGGSGDGGG